MEIEKPMPEILLFHPPNILNPKALNQSIMAPLMVGYGLLHIASYMIEKGYGVECWNIPLLYKMGFNNEQLMGIFKNYDPLLIGIELNWLHLSKGALDLANFFKKIFPNSPIVVGGVHATIFAEEIIQYSNSVDIVVKGEAEKIMNDIAIKIEKNQDYLKVAGTISKKNNKILKNTGKNIIDDIDTIPRYSIDFLRPKILNTYDLAMINTCRGPCSFNCVHCLGAKSSYTISPRSNTTFHSIKWIIEQIQILLDHVKKISIQDYSYSNPKFIIELAQALQHEKLKNSIEYFNYALVPSPEIKREVLYELARAGVDNIDLGIESGSNHILQTLKRPYNTQQASIVVKNAVENGIVPKTFWLISGLEGQEDLKENFKFLKETIEMGAIPKWVTPLCILPNTQLFQNSKEYGINLKLRSFKDFLKYSTERFNRNAYYPQTITHETELMNKFDILKAVNDLKSFILKKEEVILEQVEKNKEKFFSTQPKLRENQLIQRIKTGLKFIRGSYF